ncbi:uncharacterized protein LOC128610764 [Ictalurus furcatus]|uniref:uncharacterized protein LOC128610764 n=1 Tax=Ictalurus furcatus TaxID=66913 RepID=UPI002350C37E|nr:uncharacterized protein LOC128610764 [Ictalurus furcatus]
MGPVTYKVHHPDRGKENQIYHVNLLNEWQDRTPEGKKALVACNVVPDKENYEDGVDVEAVRCPQSAVSLEVKNPVLWKEDCKRAFTQLTQHLCEPPVLQRPDFTKMFLVQVDTAAKGRIIAHHYFNMNARIHHICWNHLKECFEFSDVTRHCQEAPPPSPDPPTQVPREQRGQAGICPGTFETTGAVTSTSDEDSLELHMVRLELEDVEKQIRGLLDKQAQLLERQTALETSCASAHISKVNTQRGISTPSPSTPCVSLCRDRARRTFPAVVSVTPAPTHLGPWVNQRRKARAGPSPPPVFEIPTRTRFAPLRQTRPNAVIVGDSIVRNVCLGTWGRTTPGCGRRRF